MPELTSDDSAIWHLLLDAGLASDEQLEEIVEEHERTGVDFKSVLYNYEIVTEDQLLFMIAENLGADYIDVREANPDAQLIEMVPHSVARQYQIMPLMMEGDRLYVAAVNPMDYTVTDDLNYVLGCEVSACVGKPDDILQALDHFYPEAEEDSSMDNILDEMETFGANFDTSGDEEADEADLLNEQASATPIVRFVNVILYQAVKDGASDIHFEPFAEDFRIRYRIDGVLYEMQPPPAHLATAVISRVKVVSGLNIAERRLPQDGRIQMRIAGRQIDLRVSTLPTQYGESVVLRILDKSAVSLSLDSLGLPQDVKDVARMQIKLPNGIFLVTGPTGSGKTTTLYSCLKEINDPTEKLLTAEDPVEFNIEGLMQVPVQEAIGMTFARALKAFLRQDPDRIMVGEIRDYTTASMSVQAALTGHLVLSTLHTNDAPGAVTRMVDMGVEPFLITSTLAGVLAQRLVRRVCRYCGEPYEPTDDELDSLGLTRTDIGERKFYYGKGCGECNNTGYKGRKGIFEMFLPSAKVRLLINQRQPARVIFDQARREGMRTLREHGVESVLTGESTVEEILKYT